MRSSLLRLVRLVARYSYLIIFAISYPRTAVSNNGCALAYKCCDPCVYDFFNSYREKNLYYIFTVSSTTWLLVPRPQPLIFKMLTAVFAPNYMKI